MTKIIFLIITTVLLNNCLLFSIEYNTIYGIKYYEGYTNDNSVLNNKDCQLDLYYPKDSKDFPTVVWLHGGGLTGGERNFSNKLLNKEVAIVAVGYRKSPSVKYPSYIEDAAAALNWTFKNIEKFGGNINKIVLSGVSAGGYLALMLALDKKYTKKYNIDVNTLSSVVSISGQAVTHYTVRSERGIPYWQATIDDAAPIFHVRNDACKIILIVGGREEEIYRRYDENTYLEGMLKLVGHKDIYFYSVDHIDHANIPSYGLDYLVYELEQLKTDIKDIAQSYTFDVSNINNDIIIDIKDNDSHQVNIYTLDGRNIFSRRSNRGKIKVKLEHKGIYLIQVDEQSKKYIVK